MALIIRLSTEEAELIHLTAAGKKKIKIHASGHTHPAETNGVNHPIHQTDEERFYHQLALRLEKFDDAEWFIASTGLASEHFTSHLKRHHPRLLKNIAGTEKIDKLSENQVVELGKTFFKRLHVFQSLQP